MKEPLMDANGRESKNKMELLACIRVYSRLTPLSENLNLWMHTLARSRKVQNRRIVLMLLLADDVSVVAIAEIIKRGQGHCFV